MAEPITTDAVVAGLEASRRRSHGLTTLDEAELTAQHSPLMSPLVWDLAHIGQQEDLWLLRGGDAACQGLLSAKVEKLYDAFEHPRASRVSLPLLGPAEARSYIADVRGRVFDGLERATDRTDLFRYGMVEQHEQQHVETMLATHQLRRGEPVLGAGAPLPAGRPVDGSVLVPGGPFTLGVDAADEPFSLDNERPAHTVEVPAFRIARAPVTNAEWQRFVDAGGYDDPTWWTARGWDHRQESGLERPLFWRADGSRRRFGLVEEVPADEPVQHVSFHEADAYARWAGARLPSEQEWEKACVWDPALGRRRRWPWGDSAITPALANVDGAALRPAPVGAYPAGASAYGVEQMIGDVWEWTSSGFEAWPGFSPMLYADYSAPFFGGDYRVLRGGSWAVGAGAIRSSFRNWDLPVRRQIFAGLRLAWDVEGGLMCRHQAWLGRPRDLETLVLAPEHGLLRQSYQPRRQARGLMNADGWGVGLFDPDRAEPVRWRSARPLWAEPSFASVAPVLASGAVLAAVRSATVGMPLDETAAAPFTDGTWLVSHNGRVDRAVLPASHHAESVCDSAVLAAHVLGEGVDRLATTVAAVAEADPAAYLNLLLVSRDRVVGLTWGDPLSYLVEPDGVAVASEPWDDDPRWVDVPDRHLIDVTPDGVSVTTLERDD